MSIAGAFGPGIFVPSPNGQYFFIFQTDGNLVGYEAVSGKPFWASGTNGRGGRTLYVQTDGNVVIYTGSSPASLGRPIWATNTNGRGVMPYRLTMQNDRNIVLYDGRNTPIWASNTNVNSPIQEWPISKMTATYPPVYADYPGNDITSFSTSDPVFCGQQCMKDVNCKGFVVATDTQACWLKSAFIGGRAAPNRRTFFKPLAEAQRERQALKDAQAAAAAAAAAANAAKKEADDAAAKKSANAAALKQAVDAAVAKQKAADDAVIKSQQALLNKTNAAAPAPAQVVKASGSPMSGSSRNMSQSGLEMCLKQFRRCVANVPDEASAPAMGTSGFLSDSDGLDIPIPRSTMAFKILFAILIVLFAILMIREA